MLSVLCFLTVAWARVKEICACWTTPQCDEVPVLAADSGEEMIVAEQPVAVEEPAVPEASQKETKQQAMLPPIMDTIQPQQPRIEEPASPEASQKNPEVSSEANKPMEEAKLPPMQDTVQPELVIPEIFAPLDVFPIDMAQSVASNTVVKSGDTGSGTKLVKESEDKIEKIFEILKLPIDERKAAIRALDPLDVIECAFQDLHLADCLSEFRIPAESITWKLENPDCYTITLDFSRESTKSRILWIQFPYKLVQNWEYDHADTEAGALSTIRIDTTHETIDAAMRAIADIIFVPDLNLSMSDSFNRIGVLKSLPVFKEFKIDYKNTKVDTEKLMEFLKRTEIDHLILNAEVDQLEPYILKNRRVEIRWSDCLSLDVFDPLFCKVIEVKAPKLTGELANKFLKHWKDGGLENMEFLSLEELEAGEKVDLALDDVLDELDSRDTQFRSRRASTPYLSSWSHRVGPESWVNNAAFDIQRYCDGRWATVIFNPHGIHLLVWHARYLKDRDDESDNDFVFV